MPKSHPLRAAALTALVAACATSRTPVPMIGPARDVAALAGEWAGDYSSTASGRSGSISFTLRPAGDSAFGDVIMIPAGWAQPEVLTINFVRVEAGHVTGTLAPYADPQTGARLLTTSSGALTGNTIEGTYTTRLPSGETQAGRWKVMRR